MIEPDPLNPQEPAPGQDYLTGSELQTQEGLPAPAPERYPFWSYRDAALLAALALPLMLISSVLVGGLFHAAPWAPPKAVVVLVAQFLFYALWFLFLYGWMKMRYDRPFWTAMAWKMPARGLLPSALTGIGTAIGVIVLAALLRPPQVEMPLMELMKDKVSLVLIGIFGVTLGPLCEELAFRGFLMPLFIRSFTAVPGIFITAALFASLHGPEYAWSWQHLMLIMLAGAAFGWMRYVSGSTAASAIMHAAYNAVFFMGMLAQRKELIH